MGNLLDLEPRIEASGFLVGDAAQNSFRLILTNRGPELSTADFKRRRLLLVTRLGSGAEALFASKDDADCDIQKPDAFREAANDAKADRYTFLFRIRSGEDLELDTGEALELVFTGVRSKTGPGKALLDFVITTDPLDADESPAVLASTPLELEKTNSAEGILSFAAPAAQGLPNRTVTLQWAIQGVSDAEIVSGKTLIQRCDTPTGIVPVRAAIQTDYVLRGKLSSGAPVSEKLTLVVLESRWHNKTVSALRSSDVPLLDDKEPIVTLSPTLIVSANDSALYGIFRHVVDRRERAFLFRTENPLLEWQHIPASVPDRRKEIEIPPGFATSPGVYFGPDQLWLVGGSRIDPECVSNRIWRLSLDLSRTAAWEELPEPPWKPRMGHAVVPFKGRLWVMGGCDENLEPLGDVWAYDPETETWNEPNPETWPPRAVFASVVYESKLYVLGGSREPFSKDVLRDAYCHDGKSWAKTELFDGLWDKLDAFAFSLFVFNASLHAFIQHRSASGSTTRSAALIQCLADPDTREWTDFDTAGLDGFGDMHTFGVGVVPLEDEFLVASALSWEKLLSDVRVYVPKS